MYWNQEASTQAQATILINFNMGCIETIIVCKLYICLFGLTLTWDVLKRKGDLVYVMAGTGLTLTWDVLKPNHVKETLPAPI